MSKTCAIGIDLGGTNLRAALINGRGEILRGIKEPSSGVDIRVAVRHAVDALMTGDVAGVGVAVAGLIDRREQRILCSPNIPSIEGMALKDLGINIPVHIENDANAAAMGELWMGVGKDIKNFVLLTLGTGIGCGIAHDGRLLKVPAEAGHMSIVAAGHKCPCGNFGCLERYASARAITEAATDALESGRESSLKSCCEGNIYRITPDKIYTAALDGDALSRDILKDAGRHLGVGIANMINIMGPDAVVLTGGLTGAWDIYVEEAKKEAHKRVFKELSGKVKIIKSALGVDEAGVLGAAGLVLNG